MKKLVIVFLLSFCFACFGADIDTLAELQTAASSGGTYTIAPGTYTLDAVLTFAANITLTHDGTAGDVIIDGEAGATDYAVVVSNCTATFTGYTDKLIHFYRGSGGEGTPAVKVLSDMAVTTVTFNYCKFSGAQVSCGLVLDSAGANNLATVTCNNCIATANATDGFSIRGTGNTALLWMYLNDCNSYSNGSGATDNAATAHHTKQFVVIDGGNFYNQTGPAIAVVGGANLFIKDATVYGGTPSNIHMENACVLVVQNCYFPSMTAFGYHVKITSSGISVVQNCIFENGTSVTGTVGIFSNGGTLILKGNMFRGLTSAQADCWLESSAVSAEITNNTFYNGAKGIKTACASTLVQNNIFSTYSSYVIRTVANYCYRNNKLNGYNCFYSASAWYNDTDASSSSQMQSTDITANPLFVDPVNGNVRLLPSSPCVDAGGESAVAAGMSEYTTRTDEFPDKGPVDMGYHSATNFGSPDIDKNLHVDFADYAFLAANWLQCDASKWLIGDIDKDECVNENDLGLLAESWLD